jgi:hypothetical protein
MKVLKMPKRSMRLLAKIKVVILSKAKNLMFFLLKSKNQKRRSFGLTASG